jgi:Choline dehydrogenase and related flavoproteins
MTYNTDVLIIGAGGGGPVVAKELGEIGLKVVLLEAGPWYGNRKWPAPNQEHGAVSSSEPEDLSIDILHKCFTNYESDMNDIAAGKLRWGPANRNDNPWSRNIPQEGFAWQSSGVGGSTLLYFANSPRAHPIAVNGIWPISYNEMIPYYEKVEAELSVSPAPMTTKDELFFYGAKKAGWSLLKTLNVTSPGYRPQPNAILSPHPDINDANFKFDGDSEGCTLCGHCVNGCCIGPRVEKVAKRSTIASYIPYALKTGRVEVRPNTFAVKILADKDKGEGLKAVGVRFRDTWTGETGEINARAVVMAAGAIESPRLWLNSKLPDNPWVGKGLTNHWFDCVAGIFDEKVLLDVIGSSGIEPYIGQNSAARFDYPGLGVIQLLGLSPGLYSTILYSLSNDGYNFLRQPEPDEPWDIKGRAAGKELVEYMAEYPRTLSVLIFTSDEANQKNGVTLDALLRDAHGSIPKIKYEPSAADKKKRDTLAAIAADILKKAGAQKIIRPNLPPGLFIHIESTMRIGYVTDSNCEARQVNRLFIADNSVHYNSLGGPNPTLTTQALAIRTAEKLVNKYFN